MTILATSENKDRNGKLELWTMWGLLSIIYSVKINGEYKRKWSKDYRTIERAGLWFRKYEDRVLNLKSIEDQCPVINLRISSDGDISLSE
jgi:hypothetical protein